MQPTHEQAQQDIIDSILAEAERYEEEVQPVLDKAAALRDKAREITEALGVATPGTPSNGKPTPNRKQRKTKPAGASKAPSKPRNDICPQIRHVLAVDLSALTEDTAHHANSIAKAADINDMPLLSRTLKYLIHIGQVAQVGVKRGARYYITMVGTEAFDADGKFWSIRIKLERTWRPPCWTL